MFGLPPNTKTRQVINRAIRQYVTGGAELLNRLEALDYMRIQDPSNQTVRDELQILRNRRDQLADELRSGKPFPLTRS